MKHLLSVLRLFYVVFYYCLRRKLLDKIGNTTRKNSTKYVKAFFLVKLLFWEKFLKQTLQNKSMIRIIKACPFHHFSMNLSNMILRKIDPFSENLDHSTFDNLPFNQKGIFPRNACHFLWQVLMLLVDCFRGYHKIKIVQAQCMKIHCCRLNEIGHLRVVL